MKRITINFKPNNFKDELEKLETLLTGACYTSYDFNNDKYSIELYIGGDVTLIHTYYLEDGITLSIYSDIPYYDAEDHKVKHITENIRMKGITSYIMS